MNEYEIADRLEKIQHLAEDNMDEIREYQWRMWRRVNDELFSLRLEIQKAVEERLEKTFDDVESRKRDGQEIESVSSIHAESGIKEAS